MSTNTQAKDSWMDESTQCRKCGETVNALAVFPGGICMVCHEAKFNAQVARNGGILPRPDFTAVVGKL